MQKLIKLTQHPNYETILIGTESIISVMGIYLNDKKTDVSRIRSRGAMVETFFVIESVDKIFELYNKTK